MNSTITNRGRAKVKFFAIYALSIVLIVLLLSSFLAPNRSGNAAISASEKNSHQASVAELLHRRIAPLQLAAVSYVEKGAPANALPGVESQKTLFLTVVDSVRKTLGTIPPEEKDTLESLLKSYEQAAENEYRLAKAYVVPAAGGNAGGGASAAEMEELKTILVQKDERIAELERQKQLAEKEKDAALAATGNRPPSSVNAATAKNDAGAAEWKEKYNKLKASTEKSAAQIEALRNSYKEVVEDNRRLIAQLQAARAGKN